MCLGKLKAKSKYLSNSLQITLKKVSIMQIIYSLDRDAEMIALFYSKDQLRDFLISLSQIMTYIKTKTDKIFIPTVI